MSYGELQRLLVIVQREHLSKVPFMRYAHIFYLLVFRIFFKLSKETGNYYMEFKVSLRQNRGSFAPRYLILVILLMTYPTGNLAVAQQHSYDPNTDNDGGQQFGDCLRDINRFCKEWEPLLFELEICLQGHIAQLSPACRSHMQNTDFRKYHREEPLSPDF